MISRRIPDQERLKRDSEICDLVNTRNPKGMRLLFDAYYKSLVSWANSFIGDLGTAEDVVQEFFIDLWNGELDCHLKPATLGAFLRVSVRNRTINRVARRDVLNKSLDLDGIEAVFQEYDDTKDKLSASIFREIDEFPARTREILIAIFVDGLKYREAAERLGISVSTVKTLLGSAVNKLREHFGNDALTLLFFLYQER